MSNSQERVPSDLDSAALASLFDRELQKAFDSLGCFNLAIFGKTGSGKSTLMHMISGAIRPNKGGRVKREGSFIRLSLGMGFNPELSARQNVLLNASILGVSLSEIRKQFDEIINFAELVPFADTQLKFYSTGMRARLAFAVAVMVSTDLLLMDEFFGGVGEEGFKKKAHKNKDKYPNHYLLEYLAPIMDFY